mgnify:FL=1
MKCLLSRYYIFIFFIGCGSKYKIDDLLKKSDNKVENSPHLLWNDSSIEASIRKKQIYDGLCGVDGSESYSIESDTLTSARVDSINSIKIIEYSSTKCTEKSSFVTTLTIKDHDGEKEYITSDSSCDRDQDVTYDGMIEPVSLIPILDLLERKRIGETRYYKNDIQIFFMRKPIPEADFNSFETIKGLYARDDKSIFYNGRILEVDFLTFDLMNDFYSKDNKKVLWKGQTIRNAEPSSFRALDHDYASDDAHVYLGPDVVINADPKLFKVITQEYTSDATNVWYRGELLEGADPETFTASPCKNSYEQDTGYSLVCSIVPPPVYVCTAEDRNNLYLNSDIIPKS